MKLDFKIDGLKDIASAIKGLDDKIKIDVLYKANRKAADIAKKELEANAPSGNNNKKSKNKIENNIKIERSKENKTGAIVGIGKRGFAARFKEFGTKPRKTDKGYNRGSMKAQPFIQRSFDNSTPKIQKFLQDEYLTTIQKAIQSKLKSTRKKNNK